jgi:hypothetical protein
MNQKVTQAVVTGQSAIREHQTVEKFALFNEDGTPVSFDSTSGTLDTIPEMNAEAIAPGDTVAEALAKLQAQIDAL